MICLIFHFGSDFAFSFFILRIKCPQMNKGNATSTGSKRKSITRLDYLTYVAHPMLALDFFEGKSAVHKAIPAIKKGTGEYESTISARKIDRSGIIAGPPISEFRGVLTGGPIAVQPVDGAVEPRNAARR
jgi:hypothetical protein